MANKRPFEQCIDRVIRPGKAEGDDIPGGHWRWYGTDAIAEDDGPWYAAPLGSLYIRQVSSRGILAIKNQDTGADGDWFAIGGSYDVEIFDGATPQAQISNAILAVSAAGGGRVEINSDMTITGVVTVSASDVCLTSRKRSTISASMASPMFKLDDGVDNITFENLQFTNTVAYGTATSLDSIIRGPDAHVLGSENVLIRNCGFTGGYHGVRPTEGCVNWHVEHCQFSDQIFAGIVANSNDLHILYNTFDTIGTDALDAGASFGLTTHAIYCTASASQTVRGLHIIGNKFMDCVGQAIAVGVTNAGAVIEDVVIGHNSFYRNSTYEQYGSSSTRFRADINVGCTSGTDANGYVRAVEIVGNHYIEAVADTGANWDLKTCIYLQGQVRGCHIHDEDVRQGSGYYSYILVGGQSHTRVPHSVDMHDNTIYLTTTDLSSTSEGIGIGRNTVYKMTDWNVHANTIDGANIAVRGLFVNSKLHYNTTRNIGTNNTDLLDHYRLADYSINNQICNNTIETSDPTTQARRGISLGIDGGGATPSQAKFNNDPGGANTFADMANAIDDDLDTSYALTLTSDDYVYIGDDEFFNRLVVNVGTTINDVTATLSAEYWNGSTWTAVTITDGTATGGKTLAKDGTVTWIVPSDWATVAIDSDTCYWIRLKASDNLTASINIIEVDVYRGADNNIVFDNVFVGAPTTQRIRDAGEGNLFRMIGCTELKSSDFALHANWGSTASVSSVNGTMRSFSFRVTSAGTGQGASPTVIITYPEGSRPYVPLAVVMRNGGSQLTIQQSWSASITALTITWAGTPIAAEYYDFQVMLLER